MLGERKGKTEGCLSGHFEVTRASFLEWCKKHSGIILLFLGMLAFKVACDAGFLWLTTQDAVSYPLNFSFWKYLLGTFCCVFLFFLIRHEEQKASSFFLYFVFLFQILPITASYAFANRSTEYYLVLIFSFALCALAASVFKSKKGFKRSVVFSRIVVAGYACILVLILLIVIWRNGIPSLDALNIYKVYDLRQSGDFTLSKYEHYLFSWVTAVILPAGIALTVTKRKYILTFVLCGIVLLLYLYCAHKTILFSIPFVLIFSFWSRRKNFYKEFFTVVCFGYLLFVILLWFSPVFKQVIERVFSLLARRTMYVPANNKFHYFDYFTKNPKMGIGGIFPRWLIHIPNYYENIPYTYEISAIYYNLPKMNSNTGFLAEGFMRFGHLGTVFIMLLFAWIMRMTDRFQARGGYPLTIGVFIYQIYSLADAHLIDSMVFGPWMLLIALLLFYTGSKSEHS